MALSPKCASLDVQMKPGFSRGVEMTTLVNTGSQISTLTEVFCNERGLRILPLKNLMKGVLHLEGTGALEYHIRDMWKLHLTIPDLSHYNKDVLFLAVASHKYGDRVPVQICTQVIDQLVATVT